MANSRANIYPVQLQGAELNLNKLDAEIKQYSGFNKNNSPFVGGCLSNIFTKDETIEGATSQNTYIAPNGDVYRVNTEGLWKNEEKLVDYTGKKFYNIEPLDFQFPDNTVYVDSEECYVTTNANFTTSKNDYFLNVYNLFTHSWNVIQFYLENNVNKAVFDIKCCKNDNTMLIFVTYKYSNKHRLGVFKVTDEGLTQLDVITLVGSNPDYPTVLHLEKTDIDNGILSILINRPLSFSSFDGVVGVNYDFTMDGTVTFRGNITSSYEALYSVDKVYKIHLSDNGARTEVVTFNYTIHNGQLVLEDDVTVDWTSSSGSYRNVDSFTWSAANASLFGFHLILKKYNSDKTKYVGIAVGDFSTPCLYCEPVASSYLLHSNTGMVVGKYVLYNNEVATGICLPSGNILICEWNTVDEKKIFRQDFKKDYEGVYYPEQLDLIFKSGDTWYKLKESEPSLRFINNQVITNVDFYYNSYDIERRKKLLFAPAWNNRVLSAVAHSHNNEVSGNIYYVASSINEYKLQDNASLILNPIPVMNFYYAPSYSVSITDREDSLFVNFYIGNTVECLYNFSQNINDVDVDKQDKTFGVSDLTGLPFPSNTDGNIQYSPSLFAIQKGKYGNLVFISEGGTAFKLMTYDNKAVMSYFLTTAIEGLQDFFTIQGQLYGILDNQIYNFSIVNEIANRGDFIVSVEGLQFVGNTPYEALFFSKTNRCLYSFTGANVLNSKQFVDKISEVRNYKYNPATQSIFLITDIGVIVYSLFGIYQIEFLNCQDMFLLNNGVILTDNEGTFKYVKYYKEETTDDYTKENIQLETMFYGMNNQTVTINDCLYMRIFSEEHEEGDLEVSATTLSLEGRMTEKTTFRIKERDWDKLTHTIYLRYQPKEQRGLGISFSINSPFKIASLSVGSQADAILIDKVSKGAINAPQRTSNNVEW